MLKCDFNIIVHVKDNISFSSFKLLCFLNAIFLSLKSILHKTQTKTELHTQV